MARSFFKLSFLEPVVKETYSVVGFYKGFPKEQAVIQYIQKSTAAERMQRVDTFSKYLPFYVIIKDLWA